MRRMTLAVVVAALSFGATQSASAQDILRSLYSSRPVAQWTGFYAGVNVGYGWANGTASVTSGGVTATGSENLNGTLLGGQAGVNYQSSNFLLGVETDFQWTWQKVTTAATAGGTTLSETDKLPWFGTTRVRAGYTVDNIVIYATGGIGYGQFRADATATGAIVGTASWSTTRTGWVVGGGAEVAINPNWSWKVEYLHFDTGTFSSTVLGIPVSLKLTDDIVRFGLNYRFR